MTTKYLLPCSCGAKTPVETTQAGGTATCTCGEQLSVPTLGRLRSFEPVKEVDTLPTKATWSAQRGILFVFGGLVALGGLAGLALNLYERSQVDLTTTFETVDKEYQTALDSMSPSQLFDIWKEIQRVGITKAREQKAPEFALNQKQANSLKRNAMIAGSIGCVGVLLLMASLAFRPRT